MSVQIKIGHNGDDVNRWLKLIHKSQIPFTNQQALNDTAFQVRKKVVTDTYPEAFDLKRPSFPGAVTNVNRANKSRGKFNAQVGNVNKEAIRMLNWHAEGGTKKPRSSKRLAVPSRELKAAYTGAIPKSQKPAQILKKKGAFVFLSSKKKIPILAFRKIKRGKKGKSGDLEIKYIFIKRAKIDKELDFYEDGRKVVNLMFKQNWKKAFIKAIGTAK